MHTFLDPLIFKSVKLAKRVRLKDNLDELHVPVSWEYLFTISKVWSCVIWYSLQIHTLQWEEVSSYSNIAHQKASVENMSKTAQIR